jgi:CYTH domain-containing protein
MPAPEDASPSADGVEIERKFLVTALPDDLARHPSSAIRQGYVAIEPGGGEVRVRDRDGAAVLTVKRGGGRTRVEQEIAIDADAFARLWPLTEGRRVEKRRHLVPLADGLVAELDVYAGDLEGLVVAEIEFHSEAQADAFAAPPWLGAEVTEDGRYKNQRLALDGAPAGVAAGGDPSESAG